MMKIALLFLMWVCCGPAQSSVIQRPMYYYASPKTWQDARTYCQSIGLKLVTIVTQSEVDRVDMNGYYAWIGLKENLTSQWYWFDGSYYWSANIDYNFMKYQPNPKDNCAATWYYYHKAVVDDCEQKHFYFCHYGGDQRKYRFFAETQNWHQAFQSCQNSGEVLAIFNTWDNPPSNLQRNFPVWTGLYHDGQSWNWSDGELSDYRNWASGSEPSPVSRPGLCGAMFSQNKSLSVQKCTEAFPYLCYHQNLIMVRENRTWEEAVDHCKSLKAVDRYKPVHLLSVESSELIYAYYQAINNQTSKVWLGLRFLGGSWFWSNGEVVSLPGLPSCPETRLSCGALVLTMNGSEPNPTIEPTDCTEKLSLLCYGI